ncbi:unnamed protein product [Notodromas monacha]|uniref:Activator of basal transcription 1 n=1 Tax=Notodromas monacha TaxID=399045 RepID=A0A7R9BK54_9CRUS|nr:unnamed protein product [Notodromas monacha]CAG0915606.1 unnamed protein product [Notodromas monacha]
MTAVETASVAARETCEGKLSKLDSHGNANGNTGMESVDVEDETQQQCSDDNSEIRNAPNSEKKRKRKAGVIYMSTVPRTLTVAQIRSLMSQFGKVGRIFLQPEDNRLKKGNKSKRRKFSEGWVEMERKKDAKRIAEQLNNQRIGYKKRSHLYDCLWNLKYLSGFKWAHLNERLEYERQVKKQRMMNEISQAKRETDAYAKAVAKSKYLSKKGFIQNRESDADDSPVESDVDMPGPVPAESRDAFLKNLFARK